MPRNYLRAAWSAWFAFLLGLCTSAASAAATRPNIVLIMTDDEDVAIHEFMPKTRALIEEQGARFDNFFVSYPFCCPSRASILRGQYAHNTKIVGNEPPWGGYERLRDLGLESSTVATWLRPAGYRVAMVGKYINRYVPERDGVPPGWDDWYVGGNAHVSYNYTLNENGRLVEYGDQPKDYLNDVLTAKSVEVIRQAVAAGQPFFLYVLPYTPHSPSVAAPRHEGMFADAKLPWSANVDEADVSDKPGFIRDLPPLDDKRIAALVDEYRRRLRSLQAIDDMVETIVETLAAARVIDNTYILYSSDNGFHMGEHRLPAGKDFPYEEDIRVPMVMRGPGVPKRLRVDALVSNIDLAPTIAEIAGVAPPDFVDGRSFLPLLQEPRMPWRQTILIERRQFESQYVELARRMGLDEEAEARAAHFDGLRTANLTYVEYGTGERELYDLVADPLQLVNIAARTAPPLLAILSERLAMLAACSGEACRRIEDLPLDEEFRLIAGQQPAAKAASSKAID